MVYDTSVAAESCSVRNPMRLRLQQSDTEKMRHLKHLPSNGKRQGFLLV